VVSHPKKDMFSWPLLASQGLFDWGFGVVQEAESMGIDIIGWGIWDEIQAQGKKIWGEAIVIQGSHENFGWGWGLLQLNFHTLFHGCIFILLIN
jgi:hypothetical protein